ncbi:MAG: response regulator [Pseudomonadales bacterium]|nr:response regulator [Pseudomonadales bacterium]
MTYTILIIDDDETLREMLREVLTRSGHHVLSAENGELGIKLIEIHSVDLVITDIYMPHTDGLEVTIKLRETHPEIKIIVISGNAPEFYVDSAIMLGAHDSLKKPFQLSELESKINSLLSVDTPK